MTLCEILQGSFIKMMQISIMSICQKSKFVENIINFPICLWEITSFFTFLMHVKSDFSYFVIVHIFINFLVKC